MLFRSLLVLDIYLAVEPEFYMIECMNPDKPCVRNQDEEGCKVHKELCRIQKNLLKELGSRSIREIMEEE